MGARSPADGLLRQGDLHALLQGQRVQHLRWPRHGRGGRAGLAQGKALRHLGMSVDVCYDGDAALEGVAVHAYDVVVLDRDLPKVHGDDVCRALVARASTRISCSGATGSTTLRSIERNIASVTASPQRSA